MSPKDRRFKSCFISAPFGAQMGSVQRVLDKTGIRWEWAKSDPGYSDRLPGDLRKIVYDVDFVIAVLTGELSDANTMFEVGIAVGAQKPVLLIATSKNPPPFNLQPFSIVHASLDDEAAISFHLDLLMRSAGNRFAYPVSRRAQADIESSPVKMRQAESFTSRSAAPESALEREIATLIERAGGRVVLQPNADVKGQKFRPDLLFWLPSGDAELLNPAVVEIKGTAPSAAGLAQVERQLLGYLQDTGVRTALIIAPGLESKPPLGFLGSPSLNVFFFTREKFQQLLVTRRLAEHLRQERNRAAHGLR